MLGAIVPGMVGGYIGKKKAEDLDDEGKSDAEILRGSRKTGAIAGALTLGAALYNQKKSGKDDSTKE